MTDHADTIRPSTDDVIRFVADDKNTTLPTAELERIVAERQQAIDRHESLYNAVTAQLEHERDGAETEDEEAVVARIYEAVRSVSPIGEAVTDHADTIRRALREQRNQFAHTFDSGPCQGASQCPACFYESQLHALDALLAERQQAIDERDAWKLKAQELDDRNKWRWPAERARAEQAIDALREIAVWNYDDPKNPYDVARAALLNLGEQP